MFGDEANDFCRTFAQRRTRKTSRFFRVQKPLDTLARNRGVRRNDAVNAVFHQRIDAAQDFVVFKIGSKLDGDRNMLAVALGLELGATINDALDEVIEFTRALQRAQVLRVGRRNVDRNVVGVVVHLVEALFVVGKRIFDRRDGILADVDTEDAAAQTERIGAAQIFENLVDTLVVEAHAVDHAFSGNQTEKTGLGVARLRERRDRADFNVTETETAESIHAFAVLVHAGSEPDRVREAKPHHFNGVVVGEVRDELMQPQMHDPIEIGHDHVVGHFRIHGKEHAAGKRIKRHEIPEGLFFRRSRQSVPKCVMKMHRFRRLFRAKNARLHSAAGRRLYIGASHYIVSAFRNTHELPRNR